MPAKTPARLLALAAPLAAALLAGCAARPPATALPPATTILVSDFTGNWFETVLTPPPDGSDLAAAATQYADARSVRDGLATAIVDRLRALGYPAQQASYGTLHGHPAPYVLPGAPPAIVVQGQIDRIVAPSMPDAAPAVRQITGAAQLFRYASPDGGTLLSAYALRVSGDHAAALVPVTDNVGRMEAARAAQQAGLATPPPQAVSIGSGDTAALQADAERLGVLLADQVAPALAAQGLRAGPPLPPPAPVVPKDTESASPQGY